MKREVFLILHDIRSEQNVGALFRTADAAGVSKIFLTGYTPAPLDRFERKVKGIAKTALGAEESLAWEKSETLAPVIAALKEKNFTVVAIEQYESSVDYKKVAVPEKVAFLLGNEVEGIAEEILRSVDVIAEIPMQGKKESLNVSVAGGIALFRMLGL